MEVFDEAIDRLRRLPGIGEKSARRLVFHLLSVAEGEVTELADILVKVKNELGFCRRCHALSEQNLCDICDNNNRREDFLCVVAYPEDVMTIEETGEFEGRYHVLRGLISPLDGVGPKQLTIKSLLSRINSDREEIEEIVFAFNPTNEGEVTINYLKEKLENVSVNLSHLGYGLPVGSEIEYTDQMTLSKAFKNRVRVPQGGTEPS